MRPFSSAAYTDPATGFSTAPASETAQLARDRHVFHISYVSTVTTGFIGFYFDIKKT
jgi:hypothetical protein